MIEADTQRAPRYLPLQRRGAVPLASLAPDALIDGVRLALGLRGHERPPIAVVDAVVAALGFRGGFSGYRDRGWPAILAFLQQHGMPTRADLFATMCYRPLATREDLAGRLFTSRHPPPRRVFLGTDGFDLDFFAPIAEAEMHPQRYRAMSPRELREAAISEPSALRYFAVREFRRTHCWLTSLNVLGDILLDPRTGEGPLPSHYFNLSVPADERRKDREETALALEWTRRALETFDVGWLDVLPFNEDLIFLRGRGGRHDFVFRDLRDGPPPPLPWEGQADPDDIPTGLRDEYALRRDYYYRRGRWRAWEEHEAETHYYARGNTSRDYPPDGVLVAYLRTTGKLPAPRVKRLERCPPGFHRVNLGGRALFVSELVTVGEFTAFAAQTGYLARRRGADPWESVNDESPTMPACGHWYDAQAYLAYLEHLVGAHTRLPTIDEYLQLHPGPQEQPAPGADTGGVEFIYSRLNWVSGARFRADLEWRRGTTGLRFACGDDFGEWLGDYAGSLAAAIGTRDLTSIHSPGASPRRALFAADNVGLYKSCKIGFRVCIDGA